MLFAQFAASCPKSIGTKAPSCKRLRASAARRRKP
ncbi:DUF6053 domain-containing protein [Lysobacter gummosus]